MRTAATGAVVAPGSVAASTTSVVPATGLTNVQLRSRGSWKCADVRGPSSADDTVVQQWSCNTPAVSQQSVDLVADGGVSEMRVRFRNANKCAQARSGDTVTQNTCDGGSDQRWKFTERPGGWRIESKWNSKCLAATGGDGTGLTLTACADVAVQLWSITSPSDGSIVEVDGSGSTTVTYLRDASDGLVQRSLNGAVTGRYAATAGGAPSAVLNASNTAVAATVGLPGGTSHSFDPRIGVLNGTWQHPNLTGHRVATTNTAGAKVGATTVYDPDGNLQAGTLPDDKPGNFDAAWHGGGGVNLEHETGLHPMIQMGARQYSPILARFLEIDPVEGGVNNDYGYVGDSINQSDLTGMCGLGNPFKACGPGHQGGTNLLSGLRDLASRERHRVINIVTTVAAVSLTVACIAGTAGAGTVACVAAGVGVIYMSSVSAHALAATPDRRARDDFGKWLLWQPVIPIAKGIGCATVYRRGCATAQVKGPGEGSIGQRLGLGGLMVK